MHVIISQEIFSEDLYYQSLKDKDIEAPEENMCKAIADELGMYYVQSCVTLGMGIISKHKIIDVISNEKSVLAVKLENGGCFLCLFNFVVYLFRKFVPCCNLLML